MLRTVSKPSQKRPSNTPARVPQITADPGLTRRIVREEMLRIESHSGPLPHPDILRDYEGTLAGAAHRIIVMAETQSMHRMDMERTALNGELTRSMRGLQVAGVVALAGLGAGLWMVLQGHEAPGMITLGGDAATMVGTFIYGTERRRTERKDRIKALSANPDN